MALINKQPSKLKILSSKMGYTRAVFQYNSPDDTDTNKLGVWVRDVGGDKSLASFNLFDQGADVDAGTVMHFANSWVELRGVTNSTLLTMSHVDEFAAMDSALLAAQYTDVATILELSDEIQMNLETPSSVLLAQFINNPGEIGNPMGMVKLYLGGTADQIEIQGSTDNGESWSTHYAGPHASIIEFPATPGSYKFRVKNRINFPNGGFDETGWLQYGATLEVGSSNSAPDAPEDLNISATKILGVNSIYNARLDWSHSQTSGGTPRHFTIEVLENPAEADPSTLDWTNSRLYSTTESSYVFNNFPYEKVYSVRVKASGYGTEVSDPIFGSIYVTEQDPLPSKLGAVLAIEEAGDSTATIRLDPKKLTAYSAYTGDPATDLITFELDAETGNVTIGDSSKSAYGGTAPFMFDAVNDILRISGRTIADKITAASYELGWLGGVAPSIYTVGKSSFSAPQAGMWAGFTDSSTFKLAIGDATKYIKWDGTDLRISGNVKIGDTDDTIGSGGGGSNRYTRFEYSVDGVSGWNTTLDNTKKYFRTVEVIDGVDQTPSGATQINVGQEGPQGPAGSDGAQGVDGTPGQAYISAEKNDPGTNTARSTDFINIAGRSPISGDMLVYYDAGYKFDGSSWVGVTVFINGSMIVTGSIGAAQLNAEDIYGKHIHATNSVTVGEFIDTGSRVKLNAGSSFSPIEIYNSVGDKQFFFDNDTLVYRGKLGANIIRDRASFSDEIWNLIQPQIGGAFGGSKNYTGILPYSLPTGTSPRLDITKGDCSSSEFTISYGIEDSFVVSGSGPGDPGGEANPPVVEVQLYRNGTAIGSPKTHVGESTYQREYDSSTKTWTWIQTIDLFVLDSFKDSTHNLNDGDSVTYGITIRRVSGEFSDPELTSYSIAQPTSAGEGIGLASTNIWTARQDYTQGIKLAGDSSPILFENSTGELDMGIKRVGEELHFYEPEDGSKVHFKIRDDTGVDAAYGYWSNGIRIANSSGVLFSENSEVVKKDDRRYNNNAQDLNAATQSGFYRLAGNLVNRPSWADFSYSQMIVSEGHDTVAQILVDYHTNEMAFRGGNPPEAGGSGSYTSWARVLNHLNYNNYAPTKTGGGASGTWGINISGYATTRPKHSPETAQELAGGVDINVLGEGFYYQTANADASSGSNYPVAQAGSLVIQKSAGKTYQYYTYNDGTPEMYFKGYYNGSYSPWRRVLQSSNYNEYAPTKTGGGASGTWGINIQGNAATATNATNATNATTASYANSVGSGTLNHNGVDSYDKIRVWNDYAYAIGMKSAQTYGWLNDYAMTFTMNNDSDRGFLWRDSDDTSSDGAMSLTTGGRLMVKDRIGFANSQSYYLNRNGPYLQWNTPTGNYLRMGCGNNSWCHFYSNRNFWFSNMITVQGGSFNSYQTDMYLKRDGVTKIQLKSASVDVLTHLQVNSTITATGQVKGSSWRSSSALKYKDISERVSIEESLELVCKIGSKGTAKGVFKEPEKFDTDTHRWFIADEVNELIPEVVGKSDTGSVENLNYNEMLPDAYAAIAKQQEIIEDQQKQIDKLTKLVEGLINGNRDL